MRWMEGAAAARSWRAWAQLGVGLVGFAAAVAVMVRSNLGLGPWDAFHVGLSRQTGISIGTASIVTGVAIVAGSLLIGIPPGPATLANMVFVGALMDLLMAVIPDARSLPVGLAMYVAALALCGLATGYYIAAGLGKGPRDGLMLGLAAKTGHSVRRVRTLIELSALAFGWAMGGPVGIGTVLFAVGIGPAVQWGLRVCGVPHAEAPAAVEP
ncbi:MAG TPA: hypothetical protein VFQ45_06100 [Longimicrobium sp.]|nr:hypothetical protein [Longimicrobium sp.]